MAYYTTTNQRQLRVNPYNPDRAELIGNTSKQASSADLGKPVKLSGDTVVLCADGDEIFGFIASVEAGSRGGHSVGGVICDVGREVIAVDEDGGLAVGDFVVAGTAVAFGTEGIANVVAAPAALTDNSGGTPADTIAAIGATYDQDEVRNAVASLAAKVNGLLAVRGGWQVVGLEVSPSTAGKQVLLRRV